MFQSLIIAFSTYSKIPMPGVCWSEKGMKYSICFFPFVGIVLGGASLGLFLLITNVLSVSVVLVSVLLSVLPIIVTGGIHMDGYLDTIDAKGSYKEKEEKLEIMKDPHVGAFAIIGGCIYFLLYFGFMYQLVFHINETVAGLETGKKLQQSIHIFLPYVLSFGYIRALSGLSVVTFHKAKKDGMLATTATNSDKKTKTIMIGWIIIFAILLVTICRLLGVLVAGTGMLCFLYYRGMAYKVFGGTTGDLAGWFLQVTELLCLAICAGYTLF